jgi:hypothetical protein
VAAREANDGSDAFAYKYDGDGYKYQSIIGSRRRRVKQHRQEIAKAQEVKEQQEVDQKLPQMKQSQTAFFENSPDPDFDFDDEEFDRLFLRPKK